MRRSGGGVVRLEQHVRRAADGRERRAQVMRDRAQEVGPELLVLGQDHGLLALLRRKLAAQGQARLARDGARHVAFALRERLARAQHREHAKGAVLLAHGQIEARCGREERGAVAGGLSVLERAHGDRDLDGRVGLARRAGAGDDAGAVEGARVRQRRVRAVRQEERAGLEQAGGVGQVEHDGAADQPRKLAAGLAHDGLDGVAALQRVVCLQQHAHHVACRLAFPRVAAQAHGYRA